MENIIDRMYLIAHNEMISISEFSNRIGVSNGYLAKQRTNNANVGSHIIEKIVSEFPGINLYWLITGNGNMLIELEKKTDSALVEENKEFLEKYLWGGLGSYDKRQIHYYEYYNKAQLKKIQADSLKKLETIYDSNRKLIDLLHYIAPSNFTIEKFDPLPIFEEHNKKIDTDFYENIIEAGGLKDERLKTILYILHIKEEKKHWDSILKITIDKIYSYKFTLRISATNPEFGREK